VDVKDLIRQTIIPLIEREVNEGQTFAKLRQIYDAMILATWYKKALKESLLGKVYIDQHKLVGIENDDENDKEQIYQRYLQAFEKGVYDLIKEEYDPRIDDVVPRKYFAGGYESKCLPSFGHSHDLLAARHHLPATARNRLTPSSTMNDRDTVLRK
jgi:hypothetical protein